MYQEVLVEVMKRVRVTEEWSRKCPRSVRIVVRPPVVRTFLYEYLNTGLKLTWFNLVIGSVIQ